MITYKEYFERRAAGQTVKSIAESIGKNPKAMNRSLERAGYKAEGKEWIWQGSGAEPLEKEMIFGRITTDSTSNSNRKGKVNSNVESMDIFDSILNSPKKSKSKNYRGFYLTDETIAFLDKIESGRRSEFVDEAIKKIARDKGFM